MTKREHILSLLDKRDEAVLMKGACHVFAATLSVRYGYAIYGIPKEDGGIPHVYCRGNSLAVDAGGKKREDDMLWDYQVHEGLFNVALALAERVPLSPDDVFVGAYAQRGLMSDSLFLRIARTFSEGVILRNEEKYKDA